MEAKEPKIRFKGFTDPWEQRKLGELCDIVGGGTPSTAVSEYWDGDIDWYSPVEIGDSVYAESSIRKITKAGYEKCSAQMLPAGRTVLFTSRAGIGDMAILRRSGCTNQGFQSLVVKEPNEPYFFYSAGGQITDYALTNASGSTFLEISGKQLERMDITIPSADEQRRIGAFFSQFDNLITLHQRKYDKLCSVKKSMLEKMFPKPGEVVPEIRFDGFTDPWEQRKLGELTIYRNGLGHEENQYDAGKYELVNLNSISIDGGLKPSGKFINEAIETLFKDDLVMVLSDIGHGDLLGRVAIIPENGRFVLNQRVALLRSTGIANVNFLFSYINSHQSYFKLQGAGSSQLNISRGSVENFEVLLPTKEEQRQIGAFFTELDNLITLHQRKLSALKNVKKSLLEKMFV